MALSAPKYDDDECHCDVKPKPNRRPPLRCVAKTGRCGMTQQEHACILAIPTFRSRIKVPKKNIPNLDFSSPMWPISRAAVNAECPNRCQDLFDLAERPKCFARERKRTRHAGQGPYPGGHWAHPGALMVPMKIRLTHLAVPRKTDTKYTKRMYGKLLGIKKKKLLDTYLDFYKKSIYFKEHKHKPSPPPPKSKADKYFRWPKKKDARALSKKQSASRITELAKPKAIPKPKPVKRGPLGDINAMDLDRLATPPARVLRKEPDPLDSFKVKPGAMTYQISDRVAEMAQPKPDLSEPYEDGFKVSKAAKTAEASARTKELATPRKREDPPTDDINEEPFAVLKRALTAACSARTAELAEPRNPGG